MKWLNAADETELDGPLLPSPRSQSSQEREQYHMWAWCSTQAPPPHAGETLDPGRSSVTQSAWQCWRHRGYEMPRLQTRLPSRLYGNSRGRFTGKTKCASTSELILAVAGPTCCELEYFCDDTQWERKVPGCVWLSRRRRDVEVLKGRILGGCAWGCGWTAAWASGWLQRVQNSIFIWLFLFLQWSQSCGYSLYCSYRGSHWITWLYEQNLVL